MSDTSTIVLSVSSGVATLTLNRPEKRNAITDDMRTKLIETLEAVAADKAIKALVLTGAGRGFCAGGDIEGMRRRMQSPAGEVAFNGWSRQQRVHHAVSLLHSMPKPTIAAVNGAATGLGADMALSCDFVVASEDASFAWTYVLRGLIPDGGGLYFLPRRTGLSRAKELVFSGRKVAATEALALGIADRLVAPEVLVSEAQSWATDLGKGSAAAIALSKSIMNRSFETPAEQIYAQGSQAQGICYTTSEHRDAVSAFLDKPSKSN